ncbi:hypothetical protein GA0070216_12414 [Micromonospora matsumotoense]|uniref:Uncharacterized protein n=1 Tax=Micromonospora matsumotoense TaxID=121616 RepID=A0A1C5ARG2_9ACTN|nr:hypothetical protein [Micromonospora matsumotoense]SCF47839.1 hypothetical protein GA0070216_12414 [Micromonospora matsumotoense]
MNSAPSGELLLVGGWPGVPRAVLATLRGMGPKVLGLILSMLEHP